MKLNTPITAVVSIVIVILAIAALFYVPYWLGHIIAYINPEKFKTFPDYWAGGAVIIVTLFIVLGITFYNVYPEVKKFIDDE